MYNLCNCSGGFQVFSLKYGSVHEELTNKGSLKAERARKFRKQDYGEKSILKIDEEGKIISSALLKMF